MSLARNTSGVNLPESVSSEIFTKLHEGSAIMRHARQVALPGPGSVIHNIDNDVVAAWAGEATAKAVDQPTVDNRVLRGYTVAVIVPFSNQFRRDMDSLYSACVNELPEALARKFDRTAAGLDAVPGADFAQLSGAAAVSLTTDVYDGLSDALSGVEGSGYNPTGFALDYKGRGVIRKAKDGNGQPLFGTANGGDNAELLGLPASYSRNLFLEGVDPAEDQVGFVGDWTKAVWGSVEGVKIDLFDQYAGGIDLAGTNQFAVRAEIEVGFQVIDLTAFRKLTIEIA